VKAVAWHGKRDVRVEEVPDPGIRKPDDVIVRITSSGVCGSDLHLYEVMTPYLNAGDRGLTRRSRRSPVQHLVRLVLDVLPGPSFAV
jgi:threonine dehydrogenase-like Zn-dependent dehydrogenase